MHLDPEQRSRVIEVLEGLPWDDVHGTLEAVDKALRMALEATVADFLLWEMAEEEQEGSAEERFGHEFHLLSLEAVSGLSDEWRLAWLARALQSLALLYGLATEFHDRELQSRHEPHSPAGILRRLSEIVHPQSSSNSKAGAQ